MDRSTVQGFDKLSLNGWGLRPGFDKLSPNGWRNRWG
jgi:hypothetical protein